MNDTTELIQALAQQVVSAAKELLTSATDPGAATNLAWIETALRDVLRQVGAEALGQWIIPGAVHTAKARAAWLSEEWMPVCTRWSALPLAI